jgi:oxygen-independent coproporphyrinogen III oxidase
MTGLYLHIPFCVRKCIYCDFYSLETMTTPMEERLSTPSPDRPDFMAALFAELDQVPNGFQPDTLFIGGGTPTELSEADLTALIEGLHQRVDLSRVTEWTCESNPGTLTPAKAALLRDAGVNRVSMGVQSFDQDNLAFLSRIHAPEHVAEGVALLRETGFTNLNLDLIYGIPGSNREKTARDIEQLIALQPDHISCYCLTFEEGTVLMKMKQKGLVREVDSDEERAQYALIRQTARAAGFEQYELSNFARPGRACRHNTLYWGNAEYIGCGPSAHSHWQGRRYSNVRSLRRYIKLLQNNQSPVDFEEVLEPEAKARETLVMWLRRLEGVPATAFQQATGFDLYTLGGDALTHLLEIGMLATEDDRLKLTEQGLFVSDRVFSELV